MESFTILLVGALIGVIIMAGRRGPDIIIIPGGPEPDNVSGGGGLLLVLFVIGAFLWVVIQR